MIQNEWYAVLSAHEVPDGRPITVKRLGVKLVAFRNKEGKICILEDRCCHRGASLGLGEVHEGCLACPFHGFVYDENGKVIKIPANGSNFKVPDVYKVKSYRTREIGGMVYLWWGSDFFEPDCEPVVFKDLLGADYSYSEFKDQWSVHYTRAIENQLDVVHLPFVHRTTIGRGQKTVIHGPVVESTDDYMKFYVKADVDNGQNSPLKPSEVKDLGNLNALEFQLPNLWHNIISNKLSIFAAFVPVDEENTVVYIRYYQRFIKVPVLKQLVNKLGIWLSIIILRQDKRVVLTQEPKYSEYRMHERLIQGDLPIVEFRKMRAKKINEDDNIL
ncbi:aromatic ring-hydroxylating oxygenase subunit alpha [Fusibacter ferrireducens]|uniref:Aromatic ring-hydroxylating dioxygenase subunit alpha n=1 Tax=Fusibacter ferrireducens TaxID=2785058 RepID=A0ABR9ZRD8_9FIRM|nr:aromatic ring-hydroxylating dioxygenase subunit alpha [Fusibacter ferrireducens]MBF4693026.1 aromatic ring-hydroxylating dioxygenase subunit alpha [Fusibacter ferrireducens]